ncbi:hypothetical protein GQ44DRAFT_777538 [Phaeosphaeriaceae sp. PMI808]|nr:hypothetical protein GQ44DRAFT_777538 [Phaeosphaeriaceae sp. PMI808]
MDDEHRLDIRSRDRPCHSCHPSNVMFSSRTTPSSESIPQPSSSHIHHPPKCASTTTNHNISPLSIKLARTAPTICWLPPSKHQNHAVELHQSTCLNLNKSSQDSSESDLWILPNFDDWHFDHETQHQVPPKGPSGEWAPLLRRAASSNRERLRARLEGDGWAFVGGKYGEDGGTLQTTGDQSEESVDEEFDVVVLSVRASA